VVLLSCNQTLLAITPTRLLCGYRHPVGKRSSKSRISGRIFLEFSTTLPRCEPSILWPSLLLFPLLIVCVPWPVTSQRPIYVEPICVLPIFVVCVHANVDVKGVAWIAKLSGREWKEQQLFSLLFVSLEGCRRSVALHAN